MAGEPDKAPIDVAIEALDEMEKRFDCANEGYEDRFFTAAADSLRDLITSQFCRCGRNRWSNHGNRRGR